MATTSNSRAGLTASRLFSQHSSNPLEAGTSDPRNNLYNKVYTEAAKKRAEGYLDDDLSSSDPLAGYGPEEDDVGGEDEDGEGDTGARRATEGGGGMSARGGTSGRLKEYHKHLARVVPGHPQLKILHADGGAQGHDQDQGLDLDLDRDEEMSEEEDYGQEMIRSKAARDAVAAENASASRQQQRQRERFVPEVDEEMSDNWEDGDEQQQRNQGYLDSEDPELVYEGQDHDEDNEERDIFDLDSAYEASTLSLKPDDEQNDIIDEMEEFMDALPQLYESYKLIDRLGTGTFSSVYKAVDLLYAVYDNKPWLGHHVPGSSASYQSMEVKEGRSAFVAIKRIYVTSGPERIRNELMILERCRGCRHVSQLITAFRHEDQVAIVMPYHRNEDFREYYEVIPMEGIKSYLKCMLRALRDIHARKIIHRDVKPANFLFDPKTGQGTLCDFGLAQVFDKTPTLGACLHTEPTPTHPHGHIQQKHQYNEQLVKEGQQDARRKAKMPSHLVGVREKDPRVPMKANRAGTRGFRAPEVLLKCGQQSGAVDIWSAGVILLFFLTRKFPVFQSNDDIEALMELAAIFGRKKMESVATLHARKFSTNVPDVPNEQTAWRTFVEKLNPDLLTPVPVDAKIYPYSLGVDPVDVVLEAREREREERQREELERQRQIQMELEMERQMEREKREREREEQEEQGSVTPRRVGVAGAGNGNGNGKQPLSTPRKRVKASPASSQIRRIFSGSVGGARDGARWAGLGESEEEDEHDQDDSGEEERYANGYEQDGERTPGRVAGGSAGRNGQESVERRRISSSSSPLKFPMSDEDGDEDEGREMMQRELGAVTKGKGKALNGNGNGIVGEGDVFGYERGPTTSSPPKPLSDTDGVDPSLLMGSGRTDDEDSDGHDYIGDRQSRLRDSKTNQPADAQTLERQRQAARQLERQVQWERDVHNALDLLEKLLEPEAVKRITPAGALQHEFFASAVDGRVEDDDDFVPHLVGEGVCGAMHFVDEVTEQPGVILRVRRVCLCGCGVEGCVGGKKDRKDDGEGEGEGDGKKKRKLGIRSWRETSWKKRSWRRKFVDLDESEDEKDKEEDEDEDKEENAGKDGDEEWDHVRKLILAGEGIAIGREPCEFHKGMVFS
ncbi:kinase-like protein [Coprinopsis marcescibilis]|uniref:non-specific serine/threonine protein kinase n=1 Tax=Coprinopsis marcescibilis TaxID=230819 RepID=A0A5C3KVL2_COPMA|nr:kinase-like protein [Coprinopsis marcescibilis]